jgi:hypothetical protein
MLLGGASFTLVFIDSSGGGTRTPDTRIMIGLPRRESPWKARVFASEVPPRNAQFSVPEYNLYSDNSAALNFLRIGAIYLLTS